MKNQFSQPNSVHFMGDMIKVLFFARKSKSNSTGDVPVYVRVTVNGQPFETATGRSIKPTNWSQARGMAIGNSSDTDIFMSHNAYVCAVVWLHHLHHWFQNLSQAMRRIFKLTPFQRYDLRRCCCSATADLSNHTHFACGSPTTVCRGLRANVLSGARNTSHCC